MAAWATLLTRFGSRLAEPTTARLTKLAEGLRGTSRTVTVTAVPGSRFPSWQTIGTPGSQGPAGLCTLARATRPSGWSLSTTQLGRIRT
jgi:hypothetical protein